MRWLLQVQRLTRFEEISEPLSISFERLSMTVGETRIIQNLSGTIHAKATCALVRNGGGFIQPTGRQAGRLSVQVVGAKGGGAAVPMSLMCVCVRARAEQPGLLLEGSSKLPTGR